jgi:hypothetical protein
MVVMQVGEQDGVRLAPLFGQRARTSAPQGAVVAEQEWIGQQPEVTDIDPDGRVADPGQA